MEKSKKLLSGLKKFTSFVIVISIIFAIFGFITIAPIQVTAFGQSSEGYEAEEITLANGDFNNSTSTYPASASSWSGSYRGGDEMSGTVISGIIELTSEAYTKNVDQIKLKKYPEYEDGSVPQTPFGKQKIENGNLSYFNNTTSSALMINTDGSDTVYGYTSGSMTLDANAFYRISVWTKTGDFAKTTGRGGVGASIALNGFDEDYAFTAINTQKDQTAPSVANYYGWKEYIFYIATDYRSYTVTLDLSVGYVDSSAKTIETANGYALFDTVRAYSISPEAFEATAASDNEYIMLINCDESETLTDENGEDIGSFSNNYGHNIKGWSQIKSINGEEFSPNTTEEPFIYSPATYATENNLGLEKNPNTPYGITERGNNILLMINTANEYKGLQSLPFKVRKNQYLKIGFWANTANLSNASAASAALVYANPTDPANEVINVIESVTGDEENTKNYGWSYYSFFIKGSAVRDYDLALQLWFGRAENAAKGIAMFDDVRIESINSKKYTDYSANFTAVDLSTDYTDNGTVTNGNFVFAGEYEDYGYPMPPASWSASSEDTEDFLAGMLPKDNVSIWNEKNISYPFYDSVDPYNNALVISSSKPISFGYTSSAISLSADKSYIITVRLLTQRNAKVYLTAKYNGAQIGYISGVSSDNKFTDYKFYVVNSAEAHDVTVDIYLGKNTLKSSGVIVVDNVTCEETENLDYEALKRESFSNKNMSAYDFSDLFACDATTYSQILMTPYQWGYTKGDHEKALSTGVNYGILYLNNRGSYTPKDFDAGQSPTDYLFFAQHNYPTASTFSFYQNFALSANTYYEIKVTAKIDIPNEFLKAHPNAVGLGIKLTETNYAYTNIIDSRTSDTDVDGKVGALKDNQFKTYSFYIAVGEEDAPATSLEFTFGGTKNISEFVEGKFYISNITFTDIGEAVYNESIQELVEYNSENADKTDFGIKVNVSEELVEDEPNTDNVLETDVINGGGDQYWYVLPSVLFGLFLVLAILAVLIRKMSDVFSRRKHKEKANSYDRDYTLHIDVNNPDNDSDASPRRKADKYNYFDEDVPSSELNSTPNENEIVEPEPTSMESVDNTIDETAEVAATETETETEKSDKQETSNEDFND